MHISQRLTDLRRERHVSLKALAQATGLSVLTLSSWERGRAAPPDAALDHISAAYGLSRAALLTDARSGLNVRRDPLPPGLRALAAQADIQPAHIQALQQLELRGRRAMTQGEWRELLEGLPETLTVPPANAQHDGHEEPRHHAR